VGGEWGFHKGEERTVLEREGGRTKCWGGPARMVRRGPREKKEQECTKSEKWAPVSVKI